MCAVAVLSFTERLPGVFHGQPDSFTGNLETADTAASREMVAAERHHQSQLGLPPFPKPIGGVCTRRGSRDRRLGDARPRDHAGDPPRNREFPLFSAGFGVFYCE